MAHNNQHQYRSPFGDTTYTKVFVGGLAWETPTEKMRAYFEQFGDILEAVIISDKSTAKSKGYGFVTFKDPASAARACVDSNPMIDGRRANCNIASFGRPRPSPPRGRGQGGGQGQSSSSTYGGGTAGMTTPQQTLHPQFYYHPYGYSTYPAYGYQGVYNPQQMQMQQYAQMQMQQYYGVGGSTSSSSTMEGPYYYGGYATRGAGYGSTTPAQRISAPSYVYYPTHMEGAYTPYPTTTNLGPFSPPNFPSSSTLSPFAPPPTRHQHASSSSTPGESQTQQSNTEETEAVTIRPGEAPTSST